MNGDEIRERLIDVLRHIAPEIDPGAIGPATRLREDLDIDSFDLLRVVIGINERLGVAVPEADYPKLATFGGAVDYVLSRHAACLPQPSTPSARR